MSGDCQPAGHVDVWAGNLDHFNLPDMGWQQTEGVPGILSRLLPPRRQAAWQAALKQTRMLSYFILLIRHIGIRLRLVVVLAAFHGPSGEVEV